MKVNINIISEFLRRSHELLKLNIRQKFDTRINSMKQLWTNLNQISSLCKSKIYYKYW